MDILNAFEVGSKATSIIRNPEITEVHSVFNRVINFWAGKRILSLSTRNVDVSQNTIVTDLDRENGWLAYGITKDSRIQIKNGHIYIDDCMAVDLRPAKIYTGIIDSENIIIKKQAAEENLKLLGELTSGPHCRIFPLSAYCREIPGMVASTSCNIGEDSFASYIIPPLLSLIKCMKEGLTQDLTLHANKILGLGNGLTPTGDDILSGIMLALALTGKALHFKDHILNSVNPAIVKDCKVLTNTLSAEFLHYSSFGYGSSTSEELIREVLSSSDKDRILSLSAKVLSIGHSSGFDLMFGIQIGIELGLQLEDLFKH